MSTDALPAFTARLFVFFHGSEKIKQSGWSCFRIHSQTGLFKRDRVMFNWLNQSGSRQLEVIKAVINEGNNTYCLQTKNILWQRRFVLPQENFFLLIRWQGLFGIHDTKALTPVNVQFQKALELVVSQISPWTPSNGSYGMSWHWAQPSRTVSSHGHNWSTWTFCFGNWTNSARTYRNMSGNSLHVWCR